MESIWMSIKVNLFANLRQIAGEKQVAFDAEPGMCVSKLVEKLCERYGQDARNLLLNADGQLWDSIMIIINQETVSKGEDVPLSAGDEVSLLLPIAGGNLKRRAR